MARELGICIERHAEAGGICRIFADHAYPRWPSTPRHSLQEPWATNHGFNIWYPKVGENAYISSGIDRAEYEVRGSRRYCEAVETRNEIAALLARGESPSDLRFEWRYTSLLDSSVFGDVFAAEWVFNIYDADLKECHFPDASMFTRRRCDHGTTETGMVSKWGGACMIRVAVKQIARRRAVSETRYRMEGGRSLSENPIYRIYRCNMWRSGYALAAGGKYQPYDIK